MQKPSKKIIAAGVATLAIAGGGAGVAVAANGDDDASDTPITGDALAQAESAALDYVGEGTVTGTEVGDEESKYEVEVTRSDGTATDVQLDGSFAVVSSEDDGAGDNGDG